MTVLVLGSSHFNSLMMTRGLAAQLFGKQPVFAHASIQAWRMGHICAEDNAIQFADDPLEIIRRHENVQDLKSGEDGDFWLTNRNGDPARRIPRNLHQLYRPEIQDRSDVTLVVLIGVFPNPGSDVFFKDYDFIAEETSPKRTLLSPRVMNEIEHPVTGVYSSQYIKFGVSDYLGPPLFKNVLDSRHIMRTISATYPNARKYLVSGHPQLNTPKHTVSSVNTEDSQRRRRNFNALWDTFCRQRGWRHVTPPTDALDQTRLFTRLELSVDPENQDPHVGRIYGELLWNKIAQEDNAASETSIHA